MISFQTDRVCGMCEEEILAGDMAQQITNGKNGNNQTHFSCWAEDKIKRNEAHNEKLRKQIEQYPKNKIQEKPVVHGWKKGSHESW